MAGKNTHQSCDSKEKFSIELSEKLYQSSSCGSLLSPFILNSVVNLFTMNGDFLRCIDTDANLIASYAENSDGNLITNH